MIARIVQSLLLILGIVIPAIIIFRMKNKNYIISVITAFITSYILFISSVATYWHLAFKFAKTNEEIIYLANHDGGAKAGAMAFGWIPVLLYILFLLFIRSGRFKRNTEPTI